MNYTLLNKLPVWCKNQGINYAIICGGSRSAPLTLSFAGYNDIKCIAANDERSAGFIALGIAKATNKPVVIITTSGTAVANLYPAIAEAFYQNIPLLVLTADREPHAAEHFDGQAIEQQYIFGKHVKGFFQLPINITDPIWFENNMFAAFELLYSGKPGPVHINFPFKEPFYPAAYPFVYDSADQLLHTHVSKPYPLQHIPSEQMERDFDQLKSIWDTTTKKLLVCGFDAGKYYNNEQIQEFAKYHQIPIIADITSNIYSDLSHTDLLIRNIYDADLFAPDLVITLGGNHTSKVLKNYITSSKIAHHWHIGEVPSDQDFFGRFTQNMISTDFWTLDNFKIIPSQKDYYNTWQQHNSKGKEVFDNFINQVTFHELKAAHTIVHTINNGSILHLANSMAVRWANIVGNPNHLDIHCNRGTSGIDGCTSTAIGMALAQSNKQHYLITGDMAFQYDSNAFFQNNLPHNLTIIVLNNQGGNIFKLIEGPKAAMPLEKYFTNKHGLTFEYLAKHFGLEYTQIENEVSMETYLHRNFENINLVEMIFKDENYKTIFENYKYLKF